MNERPELKPHAPRMEFLKIDKEFIGAVIGPGGKIIQEIQRETGTNITIEEVGDKGHVSIFSKQREGLDKAVAWIKGRFQFNRADLRSILRQIARWYDVEVEYRGPVDLHFTGQLTRNEEVKKVFEQLALTGEVHFRLEGRKVIVTR